MSDFYKVIFDVGGVIANDYEIQFGLNEYPTTPVISVGTTTGYGTFSPLKTACVEVSDVFDGDTINFRVRGTRTNYDPSPWSNVKGFYKITLPTVETLPATNIQPLSSTLNGDISDVTGYNCDYYFRYREVGTQQWSVTPTKSITSDSLVSEIIQSLDQFTEYEYQLLAWSQVDPTLVIEGDILSFKTPAVQPTVQTNSVVYLDEFSVEFSLTLGNVTGQNYTALYDWEWREVGETQWSSYIPQEVTQDGVYTQGIYLPIDKDWEVRSVAWNKIDKSSTITYGDILTFNTDLDRPTVVTSMSYTDITVPQFEVTLGNVDTGRQDSEVSYGWEYRIKGETQWNNTGIEGVVVVDGVYSEIIDGLPVGDYELRAYAWNNILPSQTTIYGNIIEFIQAPKLPELFITDNFTQVTHTDVTVEYTATEKESYPLTIDHLIRYDRVFNDMDVVEFNGTNNYMSLTNMRTLNWENFAIEFWVNNRSTTEMGFILGSINDPNTSQSRASIYLQTNTGLNPGDLRCKIEYGESDQNNPSTGLPQLANIVRFRTENSVINDSDWHHVVVQHPDPNNIEFIIDGQKVPTISEVVYHANEVSRLELSEPINFGVLDNWNGGLTGFYPGQVSQIRIWDKPLTSSEIDDYSTKLLCGDETGLRAYYSFQNVTGSTVPEKTGTYDDAQLINSPSIVTSSVSLELCPTHPDSEIWYTGNASTYNFNSSTQLPSLLTFEHTQLNYDSVSELDIEPYTKYEFLVIAYYDNYPQFVFSSNIRDYLTLPEFGLPNVDTLSPTQEDPYSVTMFADITDITSGVPLTGVPYTADYGFQYRILDLFNSNNPWTDVGILGSLTQDDIVSYKLGDFDVINPDLFDETIEIRGYAYDQTRPDVIQYGDIVNITTQPEPVFDVIFTVYDNNNNIITLENAFITFKGTDYFVDSNGKVQVQTTRGTFNYSAGSYDFNSINDSFTITGSEDQNIPIEIDVIFNQPRELYNEPRVVVPVYDSGTVTGYGLSVYRPPNNGAIDYSINLDSRPYATEFDKYGTLYYSWRSVSGANFKTTFVKHNGQYNWSVELSGGITDITVDTNGDVYLDNGIEIRRYNWMGKFIHIALPVERDHLVNRFSDGSYLERHSPNTNDLMRKDSQGNNMWSNPIPNTYRHTVTNNRLYVERTDRDNSWFLYNLGSGNEIYGCYPCSTQGEGAIIIPSDHKVLIAGRLLVDNDDNNLLRHNLWSASPHTGQFLSSGKGSLLKNSIVFAYDDSFNDIVGDGPLMEATPGKVMRMKV